MVDVVSVSGHIVVVYLAYTLFIYTIRAIRTGLNAIKSQDFITTYGKWAVVTGCTDGIGLAYSRELAQRGMNLVLISRNKSKLENMARNIESDYKVATKIIQADFSDGMSIYPGITKVLDGMDIGILVNNVGVILPYPMYMEEVPDQLITEHMFCNMTSVTKMTSLVLPGMKMRKRGAIVNLSSIFGLASAPLLAVYAASKAYVEHLSRALMYECRHSGVTVQSLTPGYVNTRMVGYSEKLKTGSEWFVPSAETFARHAVLTLGVAQTTSGYFSHEPQAWFASMAPKRLWIYILGKMNEQFRNEYHLEKAKLH